MGKNFDKELDNLSDVYESACSADCRAIIDFLEKYSDDFILLVGSGGSYSMAAAFEFLCSKAGIISKRITPIELGHYQKIIHKCAVIIFSAGGRNKDTINTYKFVNMLEAKGILTICMSINAPIKKIQSFNLHNYFFEFQMPIKKDGYLAVESLLTSLVISLKAFHLYTKDSFFELTANQIKRKEINKSIDDVLNKESIIVLYAGLTTPAAIDLESKFSETSLGNIQLVDFRNFAHGRHFWISDRIDSTGLIAIIGEKEKAIADKTLNVIPKEVPLCKIDISLNNADGIVDSLMYVFEIVNRAGKYRNINPGMPKVQEYGRKLYHINYNENIKEQWIKKLSRDPVARGVYRKTGFDIMHASEYYEEGKRVYDSICSKRYKGIVFDYDGTIHMKGEDSISELKVFEFINDLLKRKIKIGIATGRGKSVRAELQKHIHKSYWKNVIIAYYNGSCISNLYDNNTPDKSCETVPAEFIQIKELLKKNNLVMDGIEDNNPYQLSYLGQGSKKDILFIEEILKLVPNIKIVKSSHSIDVILEITSKLNIIEYFEKNGVYSDEILRIGDSGNIDGNDYELLSKGNAISVDHVSQSKETCWNFSKLGLRNIEATLNILEEITCYEDKSEFKIGGF